MHVEKFWSCFKPETSRLSFPFTENTAIISELIDDEIEFPRKSKSTANIQASYT